MRTLTFIAFLIVALLMLVPSCDLLESDAEEPNELGGNPDIELTRVGNTWGVYFDVEDFGPAFNGVEEKVEIVANDNGIVTYDVTLTFDTTATIALDSVLGTKDLPEDTKMAILDVFLDRYGATLDTTDKDKMTIKAQVKGKVTDKGIQEFVSSGGDLSRPFTVVKYDAGVGDKYEFTRDDGMKLRRTVMYRSTQDDFQVGFWRLKVIKVKEEVINGEDPVFDELRYIANHKFGLVGFEAVLKDGKSMNLIFFPPTL